VRVIVLASGSGGNALVVESAGTRVLVDCGLSLRALQKRLHDAGLHLEGIEALLLTHEHSDHVCGLEMLIRRFPLPVLTTEGTATAAGVVRLAAKLSSGRAVRIGGIQVLPVATSHDAREPVGFVFDDGHSRVGVVTDTGVATQLMIERLGGCHGLFIECNHDPDMLRLGPYPWPLKQRIASRTGHLSNEQTRDAVERLAHDRLEVVVGMHVSRENNLPALVRAELARPLAGSLVRVEVADQDETLVMEVGGAARAAAAGGGGTV
jgi:phosphoribosyl 1,2-cyclic phosphodiesterase